MNNRDTNNVITTATQDECTGRGWKAYQTLESLRHAECARVRKKAAIVSVILLAACLLTYLIFPGAGDTLGGAAIVILLSFCIVWALEEPGPLNRNEYYVIPESRDSQGRHQCVRCGWRGIHCKGIYQTSCKESCCAKCGFLLFREMA